MTKLIVYTCVFGDIGDKLCKLPAPADGVEYIAFVDRVLDPYLHETGWMLHPAVFGHKKPRLRARRHKLLAHILFERDFPDLEYMLWCDGSLTPRATNPLDYLKFLGKNDICTFRHSERNCLYQEAEICARYAKDEPEKIRAQTRKYRLEQMPYNHGLAETSVVLRRMTPKIVQFSELWWDEVTHHSLRDQISFPYAMWRLGLEWSKFPGTAWDGKLFSFKSHW